MSQTLRLCTWNIQLGVQLGTLLQVLEHSEDFHNLDLLALQEASIHDTREDGRVLADILGATYNYCQVTAHLLGGRAQANALVWNSARVHVENKDSVRLPRRHEVKLPRHEHTLLRVLPSQQRLSLVVDARFNGETMRIYVAHLDVVGFAHKLEQMSRILQDADGRSPVDLTLLAGDLNTFKIRARPSWHKLIAAAEEAGFHDITTEISWTHVVHRLKIRQKLDAILVKCPRPFHFRSWTIDVHGSDHIPVFAEITLE
jgi:endonuclease/exonuclease/phosphatase family metal-dependent hydrolase